MASGFLKSMESTSTGDAKKDEEWECRFLKDQRRILDMAKVPMAINTCDGKKFVVPKALIEFSHVLEDMHQAAETEAKKKKTKEIIILLPFSSDCFVYILQWMKEAMKLNFIAPEYEWEKEFVKKLPIPILHEMVMAAEFFDNDRMMDAFYTGLYTCGCSCTTGGQGQGKGQRQAKGQTHGQRRPQAEGQKSCGYFRGTTSKK